MDNQTLEFPLDSQEIKAVYFNNEVYLTSKWKISN